jgi:hypothetical protein
MIGFIGTSLQLQSVITSHNQWLSKICSIPCWTTSVFSSTVTNENSLFTRWAPSEWITTPVWRISRFTNELSLITSRRPEYRTPPLKVNCPPVSCHANLCLAILYITKTRSLLFVATGTWLSSRYSAMDVRSGSTIPAFRWCLTSRCLVIDYSITLE